MSGGREILVVNDDPIQLRLLGVILRRGGYVVHAFTRAREALEMLGEGHSIRAVITDLHMPDMDGWRFCQLLRSPGFLSSNELPILVVSATFAGEDASELTAELGAQAFLPAPYEPEQLLRVMEALIEGGAAAPRLAVLIVDAASPARDQLASAFLGHGYRVECASSLREGLSREAQGRPGMVVVGYALPDGSGRELVRASSRAGIVTFVTGVPAGPEHALSLTRDGADGLVGPEYDPSYVVLMCQHGRRQRALLRTRELLEERTTHLRESQERLSAVLDAIPDLILVHDREGVILHLNPAAHRFFSGGETGPEGRNVAEFVAVEGIAEGAKSFATTMRSMRADPLEVEVTRRAIRFGSEAAVLVVIRDITQRRRAESESALLAQVVEQAGECIVVSDAEGRIGYVNPAFERLSGYSRAEVAGKPTSLLRTGDPEDQAIYAQIDAAVSAGRSWSGRLRRRRHDGRIYSSEGTISPAHDPEGKVVRVVAVERDVSQQMELEHALRQAVKMEAIGTLAGGIAHDFNNLLTNILGYADLILTSAPPGSDVAQLAEVIVTSAGRASDLTGQLLGFARGGKHRNMPLDVNEVLAGVIKLLSRTLPKEIRITSRLEASPSIITGDPTQIDQVLLNLALNARDAMTGRPNGELLFSSEFLTMDEEYCAHHPGARPGDYVALGVGDNGTGIPRAIQARIFEPFFTTKAPGQGTGMGLSMVYGIVKSHAGTIRLYSEEGKGTMFRIYLPVAAGVVAQAPAVTADAPLRGSGRILVVDDEAVVRETTAAMLRRLGYEVITAADGEEAVVYYRTFGEKVDLVILDMVMPRMGGRECFAELKGIRPEVKAVLATGFGLNEAAQAILDDGVLAFAQKPFRIGKLSQIVARAMRGERWDSAATDGVEAVSRR